MSTIPRDISRTLDAQADVFARLLARRPDQPDDAWRRAVTLAEGLFPHQVEGVAFLVGRRRAILADDMGLGKTRQAIVSLQHAAPAGPYLVVCPASVKRNWAREIEQAAPGASVSIIGGSNGSANTPATWTIVNYDILASHAASLATVAWAGLVFDEAHYLKNHKSGRSRLACQLVAQVADGREHPPAVYLLTGTPLTNRPRDLFVLLQLAGHSLGRSFLSFAKRYCAAEKTDFGWKTDGASNLDELATQLHGVMLRRTKSEVLSLPPKLRTWLPIEVPTGIGARDLRRVVGLLTKQPLGDAGGGADSNQRTRTQLLAHLTKVRQQLAVAKAGATVDFVTGAVEQGEKVIVFSCFDEPIQKLAARFGDQAVVLTGRTPSDQRQGLVDRFQNDPHVRVFLANILAGGVGVTLTAATQVVFNDLDWVPANHWQAEDRAYRIGQTQTVNVTYVVARDTIDEFVQAVLQTKTALVSAVVDGTALAEGESESVLEALERAVRALSPGLADSPRGLEDDEVIARLLREAAEAQQQQGAVQAAAGATPAPTADMLGALERALESLRRALAGPVATGYRIASSSNKAVHYQIDVEGGDVTCSCPGFEYRGQCKHARDIKSALAAGRAVPPAYRSATTSGELS